MKRSFFKTMMMTGMIICAASLFVLATPGNAGADPGNSNGGSGIQTQPNINPNTIAPMSNSSYTDMKGSSGHTGATNHKKKKKSKKASNQSELYTPENNPMPK